MELIVTVAIIAIIIGVAAFKFKGCSSGAATGDTTKAEMEQTEVNHEKLVAAIPPPQLTTSLERKNLVKRLERFNDENKVSYIYLIDYGKIMAFYTMKGKVSSVNSLLTTPDQIVTTHVQMNKYQSHVIATPDLDGSYGSNGDAIFFFTTDDVYVEWSGRYMLCDQPLKLTTPPQMVIQLQDEDAKSEAEFVPGKEDF
jgi:hypothetical protein